MHLILSEYTLIFNLHPLIGFTSMIDTYVIRFQIHPLHTDIFLQGIDWLPEQGKPA